MEEDEEDEEITVTSGAQTPVTPKILMHPANDGDEFSTPVHTATAQNAGSSSAKSDQTEDSTTQNYDRASTSTIVEECEDIQTSSDAVDTGKA